MGQRADALISQFEEAIGDLTAAIESVPEGRWQSAKTPEGWTVAAAAQHVSGQFPLEMEYITAAAEGSPLPGYSWDDINGKNDSRAAKNMSVSKADVLRELREGASKAADYVRGLSDEQLDRKSPLALAGGAEVSLQQLIEGGVLIDHAREHLKSIRGAN